MRFMMRIGILILLVAGIVLSPNQGWLVQATDTPEHEPYQIVVKLNQGVDIDIDLINQLYGTSTLMSLYNRDDTFLLQTPPQTSAEQILKFMASDPNLEYAELNYINAYPEYGSTDRIYGWGGQEDDDYRGQEATRKLKLDEAHAISRGSGVRVAILDTGMQLDHPQLAGSLDGLGFDFVDNDPFPEDEPYSVDDEGNVYTGEGYGHGTHVAGIVHLVAPEAGLMPVRVLDPDGRGNNFRTANAILYASIHGASVISLSLGTVHPSDLFRDVVNEAAGMGVVIVAAAGNLNSQIKQYPAAESCAIAVTSVNNHNKKSSFSSYGDWVDLVAPGEKINSTFPVSGYAWASGTSMSAPFVSGHAALLLSLDPELSLDQVGALVGGTAQSVDRVNPAYRGLLGRGHIDLVASLQSLLSGSFSDLAGNVYVDCSP